jgi:hypothetical protein
MAAVLLYGHPAIARGLWAPTINVATTSLFCSLFVDTITNKDGLLNTLIPDSGISGPRVEGQVTAESSVSELRKHFWKTSVE